MNFSKFLIIKIHILNNYLGYKNNVVFVLR